MKYRNFYVKLEPDDNVIRQNKEGGDVICSGWLYGIFSDETKKYKVDSLTAVVGFELPDSSEENAKLFVRELIDMQYKEYCRIGGLA